MKYLLAAGCFCAGLAVAVACSTSTVNPEKGDDDDNNDNNGASASGSQNTQTSAATSNGQAAAGGQSGTVPTQGTSTSSTSTGDLDAGPTGSGGQSVPTTAPGQEGFIPIEQVQSQLIAEDAACTGAESEPEPLTVVLELVIDVSASMLEPPPNGTDSKWHLTRDAIWAAIERLGSDNSVGLLFYPNGETPVNLGGPKDPTTCVHPEDNVAIGVLEGEGSAQRQAIANALARVEPYDPSGTPTHDAYQMAFEEISSTQFAGARYILLITDGQPTLSQGCVGIGAAKYEVDNQPIIDAITAAAAQGVKTFVIGSPGSELSVETGQDKRDWLSRAARAGQTAKPGCSDTGPNFCHFDLSQAQDFGLALRQALTEITMTVIPCKFPILPPKTGEKVDLDKMNLIYRDGSGKEYMLVKDPTGTCEYGWRYTDNNQSVEICGASCDHVKADSNASIRLLFGCEPIEQPVA